MSKCGCKYEPLGNPITGMIGWGGYECTSCKERRKKEDVLEAFSYIYGLALSSIGREVLTRPELFKDISDKNELVRKFIKEKE